MIEIELSRALKPQFSSPSGLGPVPDKSNSRLQLPSLPIHNEHIFSIPIEVKQRCNHDTFCQVVVLSISTWKARVQISTFLNVLALNMEPYPFNFE